MKITKTRRNVKRLATRVSHALAVGHVTIYLAHKHQNTVHCFVIVIIHFVYTVVFVFDGRARATVRLAALVYVGRGRTSTPCTRARAPLQWIGERNALRSFIIFSSSYKQFFFLLFQNGRVSTVCLECASAKCFRVSLSIKPILLRLSSSYSVHYIRSPSYAFPRAVPSGHNSDVISGSCWIAAAAAAASSVVRW